MRKNGQSVTKKGLFGPKMGQNRGFAVTDLLTGQKCKLLKLCCLREIYEPKKDFHRVGEGSGGIFAVSSRNSVWRAGSEMASTGPTSEMILESWQIPLSIGCAK
jgi:hypothetical protein